MFTNKCSVSEAVCRQIFPPRKQDLLFLTGFRADTPCPSLSRGRGVMGHKPVAKPSPVLQPLSSPEAFLNTPVLPDHSADLLCTWTNWNSFFPLSNIIPKLRRKRERGLSSVVLNALGPFKGKTICFLLAFWVREIPWSRCHCLRLPPSCFKRLCPAIFKILNSCFVSSEAFQKLGGLAAPETFWVCSWRT